MIAGWAGAPGQAGRSRSHGFCLVALCLLLLDSCAKIAPPLPPIVRVPEATQELRLIQTGGSVKLLFPVPSPDIKAVLIHKQCGPATPWSSDTAAQNRVEVTDLKTEAPGLYAFVDTAARPDCQYAIRYVNDQNRLSAFSNTRAMALQPPPEPPTNVKVQPAADRLIVTWASPRLDVAGQPAHVVGYLVNGRQMVSVPRFEDRDFAWGVARTYRVQAVGQADNPLVLSEPSPEVSITPLDTFGPPPPAGLVGLFSEGEVQLVWRPPDAKDLKGYRIYRGPAPGQIEKIADLVTENGFVDQAPPSGDTVLYYQVSSVDQKDNEGEKSEPVRVERGG
ncbi:MAG: fibronectin type III domain-containing protein [Acidobacteriota bacterium]